MEAISIKRAKKIARNINAMDIYYQYSDDMKVCSFWNGLRAKLINILDSLNEADKRTVASLCEATKRKYFKL